MKSLCATFKFYKAKLLNAIYMPEAEENLPVFKSPSMPPPSKFSSKRLSIELNMNGTRLYCHLSSVQEDALNQIINLLAIKKKNTSFKRLKGIKCTKQINC